MVFLLNSEFTIPENAPVRLTSDQLEELDYTALCNTYSPNGRKSAADPRVLFKVLVYGYQCGVYSSRKLEEACIYRLDFKWLLEDNRAPDHTTLARFRTGHCKEVIEDLFYQYARLLEKQGETDHKTVFIDGSKLESRAGRYTFVWRKKIEKSLAKVQAELASIGGFTSLVSVRRFLRKKKKQIHFVHGSGRRKSRMQRFWEKVNELAIRWENYEEQLEIMRNDRNSYAKTDHDATFMRMKDDHMRNGQLKPGYNAQIAVNSEYITGIESFPNRTDFGTLKPFLSTLQRMHHQKYEEVVADAGYESLENYLYLDENGQSCFIKPANHHQKKTAKFKKQIGRVENMTYDADEDCFTCAEGRKLPLRRELSELKHGQLVQTAWYRCEDCTSCPQRAQCSTAKDENKPKELKLQKTFQQKRAEAEENITTERGIFLRKCRSVQVEGAFGLLKNDFAFRRFLTRGKENIQTELFLLALAFNLKKLWMKRDKGRLQTRVSEKMTA